LDQPSLPLHLSRHPETVGRQASTSFCAACCVIAVVGTWRPAEGLLYDTLCKLVNAQGMFPRTPLTSSNRRTARSSVDISDRAAMGSPLAKNNAFGIGSPSWNLSFPSGNLTAAEILAYLPHWLKSVDVVDRFVTNGGKSYTIAAIINEFRYLPGDGDAIFRPNSVQIMMSYGMRRAGYEDWTVGTHCDFVRPNPELEETNLNVQTFRPPRATHPKSAPSGQQARRLKHNEEAEPVEFKDLALHVRKHPSGSDALDLARCVAHALAHPDEDWYFPNDFEALVKKLGGPADVTHSHLDWQIFSRRDDYTFPSPAKSTPRSKHTRTPTSRRTGSGQVMPQSRRFTVRSTTPASGSPLKRMMTAEDMAQHGSRRKSGRLVNKASINFKEYDSDATVSRDGATSH
jgi:hypothetical protein